MSRSGTRDAVIGLEASAGSPSEARTTRPDSKGTMVTSERSTSASANALSAAFAVAIDPRARAGAAPPRAPARRRGGELPRVGEPEAFDEAADVAVVRHGQHECRGQ